MVICHNRARSDFGVGISPTGTGTEGGLGQLARARCRTNNRTSPEIEDSLNNTRSQLP